MLHGALLSSAVTVQESSEDNPSSAAYTGWIIRLIIQTIRQDRSGSVQIDAEHQATDLVVG